MMWADNDLTVLVGGTPTSTPSTFGASALDGYSQGNNSQHVNFIDRNGHVHELHRNPDPAVQWVDNDLTKFAGGTPASMDSVLDGYWQGDNSQHVNFIDAKGHVHELHRNPDPAAQWVDNDLTKFAGTTPIVGISALHGYSQGDNSQHVNFIDRNGHVHELHRNPDPAAQWVDNDLTKFAGTTPAAGIRELHGYSQADNSQHVNFIDRNGHVHELHRNPDPAAQWVDNDLTKFAGTTPAAGIRELHGYSQADNSQHVNFIDAKGHVHELHRNPDPAAQWVDNDLTVLAIGTPAVGGSALDGYSQGDNSQHVNFIDRNGHVHELHRNPDPAAQWVDNDLTKFAGTTPAVGGSGLDGYSQGDNSQHVNFIDRNGHVHELYRNP